MQLNFLMIQRSGLFIYLHHVLQKKKKSFQEYKQIKEVRRILETESIHTFFQPIVELKTGRNIGYEIFNRPPRSSSFSNTEKFYDFIGQTDQVLFADQTCRKVSLERFSNCLEQVPDEKQALLFLNIHPKVLMNPQYDCEETLKLLMDHGLSPNQVIFEISEKSAIENYVVFEEALSHYRAQGFRIALDDAGSGYNSLKTLVYLKPEFLKLDKTLIQYIDQDKTKQQLVKLLLDFSNQFGTFLIAEGIEREQELNFLREQGIHIGQGYALGKPSRHLVSDAEASVELMTY